MGRITPSFIASQVDEVLDSPYLVMDGSLLICPKGVTSAMVWDMNTNSQRGLLKWDDDEDGEENGALYWALDAVRKTAVSTHRFGDSVKIWDLETYQHKVSIESPRAYFPFLLES